MRILMIMVALLILAGCAATPVPIASVPDDSNIIAVGTLADANDPYGMAAAPVITQAKVVRIMTLRALKRGRIDKYTGGRLQSCVDNTINAANAAMAAESLPDIEFARLRAVECREMLDIAKQVTK